MLTYILFFAVGLVCLLIGINLGVGIGTAQVLDHHEADIYRMAEARRVKKSVKKKQVE